MATGRPNSAQFLVNPVAPNRNRRKKWVDGAEHGRGGRGKEVGEKGKKKRGRRALLTDAETLIATAIGTPSALSTPYSLRP